MDSKAQAIRSYEDFLPSSSWVRQEGQDTVMLSLPGFKKDQLRIQMDNQGNLKISGERLLEGNRWSRFQKDFHIPENFDTNAVQAKLVSGFLSVIVPKKITHPTWKDSAAPTRQPPANKENESKTKPEKNREEINGEPQTKTQMENYKDSTLTTQDDTEDKEDGSPGTKPEKNREEINGEPQTKTQMENYKDSTQTTRDDTEDKEDGSPGRKLEAHLENIETSCDRKQAGVFEFGLGSSSVSRQDEGSRVVVYVGVAVVVVALGIYATYKLRSVLEELESFEN
ncbi:hypothetical protein NE237_010291 [Protea cynaroides]|uniref:SHSP domain-containing protein n=1 Tax=Protea cynaroides TaxID=273540 RepID=A0A9Q0KZG5_9MAGN|nr:hypothetical protein NE237_010291 [Protea cynaroides]